MASNPGTQEDVWSATADVYTGQITAATGKAGDRLIGLATDLHPFNERSHVLDSGAGTGELTSRLLTRYPGTSVTATDISPGMLRVLSTRNLPIKTQHLDATGDYVEQGLQEGQFSHVLSTMMHQFIPAAQKSLEQSFRVLQPGGVVGVGIWTSIECLLPFQRACKNLDPNCAPPSYPPGLFAWTSAADMVAAFHAAGFEDVRSDTIELWLEFGSAEAFAEYWIEAKNPGFEVVKKSWNGDVEDVRAEMIRVVRREFRNGKFLQPAALAAGRKPTAEQN